MVDVWKNNGSANRSADLVADIWRRNVVGRALALLCRAPVAVARGPEERAVQAVGAGLGRDNARGRRRVLRVQAGRLHAHFLNGVGIGKLRLAHVAAAKLAAFQGDAVGHVLHAVAHKPVGALSVRILVATAQSRRGLGRQLQNVAPVHRQLIDALILQRRRDGAVVGGRQLHRVCRDRYLLGHVAGGHTRVDSRVLRYQQFNGLLVGLHTRRGDGHHISSREQIRDLVEADRVRFGIDRYGSGVIDHMDR